MAGKMRHINVMLGLALFVSCNKQLAVESESALTDVRAAQSADYIRVLILPENAKVAAGRTMAMRVIGLLPYGKDQELTSEGTYSSSGPEIFAFSDQANPATGLALKPGHVTITFSSPTAAITTDLEVTSPILEQVKLTQDSLELKIDKDSGAYRQRMVQISLLGLYSGKETRDVTSQAAWTSSNDEVLSPLASAPGTFAVKSPGSVQISVTFQGKIASLAADITEGSVSAKSLSLSLAPLILPLGLERQTKVTATYSDNTTADVTASTKFEVVSGPMTVTHAGANTAQLVAQAPGQIDLKITYRNLITSFSLAGVNPLDTSLSLSAPQGLKVPKGEIIELQAWRSSSDGTLENVSSRVSWSMLPAAALVGDNGAANGRFVAAVAGLARVTAKLGALVATSEVTITNPRLKGLTLDCVSAGGRAVGQSRDFKAAAIYSDNSQADATSTATWTMASQGGQAVLDGAHAEWTQAGNVTIKATLEDFVATCPVTVVTEVPVAMTIQTMGTWSVSAMGNPQLSVSTGSAQLKAMVTYSNGDIRDQTADVTWGYVIVGNGLNFAGYVRDTTGAKGACVPLVAGTFTATAAYEGMRATRTIEVIP